jgi:dihydrolipoamide dehydrogenase
LPHVYAIGDLVGGFQLAHAASAEGKHVVDTLLGKNPDVIDQMLIPRCVYSQPEIATFGLLDYQVGEDHTIITLPLDTNPKALMEGNRTGFVKLIASTMDASIIGACVVGDGATEILNSILATAVAGGTAEQLTHVIFPHPTMSEHIGEAAAAVFNRAASALEGREIVMR